MPLANLLVLSDEGLAWRGPRLRASCAALLLSLAGFLVGCVGAAPGLNIVETDSTAGAIERSKDHPGVTCRVVESPMRDGTILRGYLYLPDSTTESPAVSTGERRRLPAILDRTPYGHVGGHACFQATMAAFPDIASRYARADYAYLLQATRGTSISDGEWTPFAQERLDGFDAISWIVSQPWSNGDVGLRGPSYHGVTAVQAAASRHPNVRAAAFFLTAEDYHREWTYHHGVPMHAFNMAWAAYSFAPDAISRRMSAEGASPDAIEQAVGGFLVEAAGSLVPEWLWHLPLDEFPRLRVEVPPYYEWLEHPEYDAFWREADAGPRIAELDHPVLIYAAWYDIFANGAFEMYRELATGSQSPAVRAGTKLFVSQYGHANDNGTPTFGPGMHNHQGLGYDEAGRPFDMAFFDRYLKNLDNGYEETPKVRLAVMVPPDEGGEGFAFDVAASAYPLPGTKQKELFLASGGRANTRDGDGRLLEAAARAGESAPSDTFVYDPRNPVPSVGGNLCCGVDQPGAEGAVAHPSGASDQARVEEREDVLVYTSAPLDEDLVVIGPVSVTLHARSSAPDTDFTAKLVDLHPDGATHNVVDGIVRARFRRGSKLPTSLIVPDQSYEYRIDLGHTASVFPAGHRVRLQISSSNFPRFARNLNTGESNESTSELVKARQTVLHDGQHPSRIILPIVPDLKIPRSVPGND